MLFRRYGMTPSAGNWIKSSLCSQRQPNCVEVRFADGTAWIRSSLAPAGPVLAFSRGEWEAFELGMARGDFSMPDDC